LISKASEKGYASIQLVGESEIEFILEWACQEKRLSFTKGKTSKPEFFNVSDRDLY
jgi:hypothetical protein